MAVDAGGHLTHCVVTCDDGAAYAGHALTDPDPAVGFFGAIDEAAESMGMTLQELFSSTARLVLATTVGKTALAGRSAPQVALLTTEGHGDVAVSSFYDLDAVGEAYPDWRLSRHRASPVIEDTKLFEIPERVDPRGNVLLPLDETRVRKVADHIRRSGITSIAVSLLWSHVNPEHERRVRGILEEEFASQGISAYICCGHEVSRRSGEVERTASVVANAYLAAPLDQYLSRILERARVAGYAGDLLLGSSDGTLIDVPAALALPLRTLQGGARAAIAGCQALSATFGSKDVVFTDLGATSFDVAHVDGADLGPVEGAPTGGRRRYDEIIDWGNLGGGTVAWIDDRRRLRVGPRGSGAWPGPACFGRGGTDPTLTDADLVLGVLNPDLRFPGGKDIAKDAADEAIRSIAEPLGMTVVECAAGIVEIADAIAETTLARAVLNGGNDPGRSDLWATGGVAGMHASSYAFDLGFRRLVLPMGDMASDWAAFSLAMASDADTFSVPLAEQWPFDTFRIDSVRRKIKRQAMAFVDSRNGSRLGDPAVVLRECVYFSAVTGDPDIGVSLPAESLDDSDTDLLVDEFQNAFAGRYGSESVAEVPPPTITRVEVSVEVRRDLSAAGGESVHTDTRNPGPDSERLAFDPELRTMVPTAVFWSRSLQPGDEIGGRALIDCPGSTVSIRAGQKVAVDASRNFIVTAPATEAKNG